MVFAVRVCEAPSHIQQYRSQAFGEACMKACNINHGVHLVRSLLINIVMWSKARRYEPGYVVPLFGWVARVDPVELGDHVCHCQLDVLPEKSSRSPDHFDRPGERNATQPLRPAGMHSDTDHAAPWAASLGGGHYADPPLPEGKDLSAGDALSQLG